MAEGLCRSVVEAMGRGCGVICTRVCGNVELADKEFLYEKKDFGTLAKLMKKMMDRKVLSELHGLRYSIHGECVVLSVWFVYQLNYNTGRPIRLSFYHLL